MARTLLTVEDGVWEVMLTHAFSAEAFEVMGLLIGETKQTSNDNGRAQQEVHVTHVKLLTRSDKQKDRVEISPSQQTAAAVEAEELSAATGRSLSVIGWYHSHPHITVWPSHVDLRTQQSYQLMDPSWIGIIVACFQQSSQQAEQVEVVAFRSVMDPQTHALTRVTVPITNVPPRLRQRHPDSQPSVLSKFIEVTFQEEQEHYRSQLSSLDDTDSVEGDLARRRVQASYISNLSSLLTEVANPLLSSLQQRLAEAQQKLSQTS